MAVAEFAIYPFVEGSFPDYVKVALDEAERSGLAVQIGPLGTSVEGELSEVLGLLYRIQQMAFDRGAEKFISSVEIDAR